MRLIDLVVTPADAPEREYQKGAWADGFNAAIGVIDPEVEKLKKQLRALRSELIDVYASTDCNEERLRELVDS